MTKDTFKRLLKRSTLTMLFAFISSTVTMHNNAMADIQPRSASLNYSQKSLSNAGNPAAAAYIVSRNDPHVMTGGLIELGGGIEYGDFDELFAQIDALSDLFNPPSDGGDGDNGDNDSPEIGDFSRDYQWIDLFQKYPELEGRLDAIKTKVATTAGLLAVIAAEGYAKAEATSEMSFVLSENFYEGTLLLGASFKGNSKAIGIFDEINFDRQQATEALKTIPSFSEDDPIQELDLSGGISLFYNPENKDVKMTVTNDSLLLIKATKTAQLSATYSREAMKNDEGVLYWGVKPTLYRVGLTNVSARIGEITDTEELFDDMKNANFIYENGFDVDLGLVWAAKNYQLGASVTSLIEQDYDFPELDKSGYESVGILRQLHQHESYTMERQVKLDAGIFTTSRHWSLNAELDVNAVSDPMRDEYQWLTITGGYASESFWLPSARAGFSRNLAGSELTYLNAGITAMKFINLDAAMTLDTVTLDGKNLKRGFNVRLGVQFDY